MSQQLSNDAVKLFEAEVKHVFQPMVQEVRNIVRVKQAVGANAVQFPVMGRGVSSERTNIHTDIPVMNVTHQPVSVTTRDWAASELTDIFKNNQVSYDERQELVKTINMAFKRRLLQLIIDALVAAGLSKTVAKNVSGSNDNLNLTMLRATAKLMDLDGVDPEDRTFLAHTNGMHYLTKDSQVTSSDFNTVNILTKGKIDTYYGFNFFPAPNLPEGGLPLATNDRSNFAFQKMAVGLAINMDPTVKIDWEPSKGAWRVTGFMSANAVVIDPLGAVKITTDESLA
jgi:hypothetical protein